MGRAKPVSIVHVLHHLVIGGMENGLVNLINGLPHDEFQHTVVCIEDFSDFRDRIQRKDVQVLQMHRSRIGVHRLRWQLLNLFRRLRPSIVHSRAMSGLDALLPARLAGAATVHSEHGFDSDAQAVDRKSAWLRRIHSPLVNRYITVSRHLHDMLVHDVGIASRRIDQVYNGVDISRFVPAVPPRRDLLPANLQGDHLVVLGTVGRARAVKDQATLLRAAAAVLAQSPHWRARLRVVLVGDGPMLSELQALAAEQRIADLVWFAGARHDVPALLQCLDIFVLPSLNEGISNTVLEAMATGLPVLATAVGGNVELVDKGVMGDTFAPGDVSALASRIAEYLDSPELVKVHGRASRARAEQCFSLQSMLAGYRSVYLKM